MNEYYPDHVLTIPNATPETRDAAQYMFYRGRKQYNLCGQFCVAFCVKDETATDNIDDYLAYWEAVDLKWYQTLFKNGLARTTGIYDLEKMLTAYGYQTPLSRFADIKITPLTVFTALDFHQAIVGVKIDSHGYLVGSGIPHWVVVDRITVIDELHAIVDVYNPFTNAMEPYSWRELMISTGSYKQGIWVPRD